MAAPIRIVLLSTLALLLQSVVLCKEKSVIENADSEKEPLVLKTISGKEFVLMFLYKEDCQQCMKNLPRLQQISESHFIPGLEVMTITDDSLFTKFSIKEESKLIFFRQGLPVFYEVPTDLIETDDVVIWMEQNKMLATKDLGDDNFEHLTQAATGATTGDWFVLFYEEKCNSLLPVWETLASRMKHRINVAKVDVSKHVELKKRFKISQCPTLTFFRHGKMFSYNLKEKTVQSLVSFVEGWYKNVKSEKVPPVPSPFDELVESIVVLIKSHLEGSDGKLLYIGAGVFVFILVLFMCCCRGKIEDKESGKHD